MAVLEGEDEMNKYYFVTYVTRRLGKQFFDSTVIDEHPFDWLKRTREEISIKTILVAWQEISEEEYNKFNMEGMKDDFIQTGTLRANPLESQRDSRLGRPGELSWQRLESQDKA